MSAPNSQPPFGLFVTGTDTEVGKTYVAAELARLFRRQGCRVGVYKPVASGCDDSDNEDAPHDGRTLWMAAGQPAPLRRVCPQTFAAPLAPHLAARREGRQVDSRLLREGLQWWAGRCDVVLVEGVGGLMSPVADDTFVADLAYEFGYPLIVVAPDVLGTINQTLQTLITAATFRDGISVSGLIVNRLRPPDQADASAGSNAAEIRKYAVPPVLAELDYGGTLRDCPELHWQRLSGRT